LKENHFAADERGLAWVDLMNATMSHLILFMLKRRLLTALGRAGVASVLLALSQVAAVAEVRLARTPNGGIQPQIAQAPNGALHLIYFKGEPIAGDVFYTTASPAPEPAWSKPIRVNSVPGSVIATGTIRGAHLAIDGDGRPHVAWMGSSKASPRPKVGAPMLYTRLNLDKTAFKPQRNVVTWATGLDGGGSLAADRKGNVYVAWHAGPEGHDAGEEARAVFVARSSDSGKTFVRETRAGTERTGACGCCGMRAFADKAGNLALLYRTANGESRDMNLLVSSDQGASFKSSILNKWAIFKCPMSSATLTEGHGRILATTEKAGRIGLHLVDPKSLKTSKPGIPFVGKSAKHPIAVDNSKGESLLASIEGSGWNRGGKVTWQIYNATGNLTADKGRGTASPTWSLLSAVALPNDDFLIFY
jgi:hypothetical protein